jgi:hypothetical protein
MNSKTKENLEKINQNKSKEKSKEKPNGSSNKS